MTGPRGPHQGLDAAALEAASQEYLRVFATHREALVAALHVYLTARREGAMQEPPDLRALGALVKWQVRGPCEQYRYSECRYCHASWWDTEQHNFDCIVPYARQELQAAERAVQVPS